MQPLYHSLNKNHPRFFAGANSGEGFYSLFDALYQPKQGDRMYIIKGGPGTGKSTLMKHMAVKMAEWEQPVELYSCSSDPDSLDGVRFPSIKVAMADGTAPHVMEAHCLGVCERLVCQAEWLDYDQLERKRDHLLPLYEQNKRLHQRASRFIAAAARLSDDSFTATCEVTDLKKAENVAMKLGEQMLAHLPEKGMESRRFLSGITPKGLLMFEETLAHYAKQILVIEDEQGAASSVMMSVLRQLALERGHQVITCLCALHPSRKIDHLIIPTAQIAFCTTNSMMPITLDTGRRIHAGRFRDTAGYASIKQRLRFNRRASEELLDGACQLIAKAKEVHDQIEACYVEAMDFTLAQQHKERLVLELKQRLEEQIG